MYFNAIGLTILLAAVVGLYVWREKKRKPPTTLSRSGRYREDNGSNTAKTATGNYGKTSERENLLIVLKDKSFLFALVMICVCVGYFIRMLPFGILSHLSLIAAIMFAIHTVTSKWYVVKINWYQGNVFINAEIQLKLLPKVKMSRVYQFQIETTTQ